MSAGFISADRGPRSVPPFEARCEHCRKVATFTEGRKERRRPDFTTDVLYYFECANCKAREEKVLDPAGVLHKWSGNRHVAYKPGT